MRRITIILLSIVLLLSFGCGKFSHSGNIPETGTTSQSGNNGKTNPGQSDKNTPGILAEGEKSNPLILANRRFSWEIFKKISAEDADEDVFISPLSISTMLTMAMNGAGGTTKDEMEETLKYTGLSLDEINQGYAWLMNRMHQLDPKIAIEMANSIWAREGFQIQTDYIERNQQFLSAEVHALDFDLPEAADTINHWISQKTHDLIPKMIDPPIDPDVMMYLINAIYFKGEWTTEFETKNTSEQDFHAIDGKTDTVSMMRRTGKIDYFSHDDYTAVSLPYGNEKTSLIVILPNDDINRFIENMQDEKWEELLDSLRPVGDLNLQLPKFKLEYGIKELTGVLSALGMEKAFTSQADFTGIAERLYISKVLHKAVVDINEEGTEAAAVTVGEIKATSYVEPISFIADRPFLFVIADREAGDILFMGKKLYGDR